MTSEGSGLKLVDFLDHIAEASRLAREYVDGMSRESFLKDRRTQQAVILNLMTIGEAAERVTNEHKPFEADHPEIPWAWMPRVSPRWIVTGHADDQIDHRAYDARPPGSAPIGVVPFLRDQLPVPSQRRLGSHYGPDLAKDLATERVGLACELASFGVCGPNSFATQPLPDT
jgi:Protein of unknown function DUF86